jgi:hypothetical protein
MDIRVVESLATSGGLIDPKFRVSSTVENISLNWDEENNLLSVVDYNLDYSMLPWQLETDIVKKVFLTYNGKNCSSGQMLETVLVESSGESNIEQTSPGFRNSNEWSYNPSTFKYPDTFLDMTSVADYSTYPYDYSQGFTVVKQFLTAQANLTFGTPAYTAFYRAPHLTSFLPANIESNKIYVDGWYTSYVIAVKTWAAAGLSTGASTAKGNIIFFPEQDMFYINLTGLVGGTQYDYGGNNKIMPKVSDWKPNPTFTEWMDFIRHYNNSALPGDPVYYAETQHLVTVELNKAIIEELKKQCSCCCEEGYGSSAIMTYMKLIQKRMGAYIQFNSEVYHEASCILESSRKMCDLCLYGDSPCSTC